MDGFVYVKGQRIMDLNVFESVRKLSNCFFLVTKRLTNNKRNIDLLDILDSMGMNMRNALL